MKCTRFTLVAAAIAATSALALAEGEDAPSYPELSVTLGGTLNDGNTEDKSGNIAVEFKDILENVGEYTAGADGTITKTTVRNTKTAADGTTTTSDDEETTATNGPVFGDEIADIDYRAIVGAGLAVDLYKSETVTFRVEAGVAPMWEKIADESEYYTMGRVAEIAEYYFAGGAKFWESCEYLPAFDDSDKYLVNAEVGVESPLNDLFSLRFSVKDRYNSLPGDGHEKNDVCATVGIRVKL